MATKHEQGAVDEPAALHLAAALRLDQAAEYAGLCVETFKRFVRSNQSSSRNPQGAIDI